MNGRMAGMSEGERAPSADRVGGLESRIRAEYERCHPQESFDDLKRRALFSKEDKGLLRQWLEAAAYRGRQEPVARPS